LTTTALVDTGAIMLAINENIATQLNLHEVEITEAQMADGSIREIRVVGPVEVRFKTRRTVVNALVLPGDCEVLLGAIPIEGMDVIVDPVKQEMRLPDDRPYVARMILKGIK